MLFVLSFSSNDTNTKKFLGELALERTVKLNHLPFIFSHPPLQLGVLWLNGLELLCMVCMLSGLSVSYCEIAAFLILPVAAADCQENCLGHLHLFLQRGEVFCSDTIACDIFVLLSNTQACMWSTHSNLMFSWGYSIWVFTYLFSHQQRIFAEWTWKKLWHLQVLTCFLFKVNIMY